MFVAFCHGMIPLFCHCLDCILILDHGWKLSQLLSLQVKIQGQNEEMLLAACEQFLGKNEDEITQVE